jgi:hemerythrin-like domain-containing protein
MMYSNRVCQKLHEEHMATLALLERLERFVANKEPPGKLDIGARTLLSDLAAAFESEIRHHFAFEEKYLFDYFATSGDTEMAQHLTTEHERIRNLGERTIAMARAAASSAFSPSAWSEFRLLARHLVEQLTEHVHKEEGVLVPLLQDCMESDTEEKLYMVYVMGEETL